VVDLIPILEVDHLTKMYGRRLGIEGVSFDVAAGEIIGLLGPNGSGKSTTLHCLTGILAPTSGRVQITGIAHDRPAAKDGFGFVPDDLPMPESLRAPEVLALHRKLRSQFDRDLAEDLLELVGLADHRSKYVGEYSHGMKRKLQLVTALAHGPRLLIMDEPMRGLDPEAGIIVKTLLETFREQGGGVLVATHDLLAAEHYCDRVVILTYGKVIATGEPSELIGAAGVDTLEELFVQVTGLADQMAEKQDELRQIAFFETQERPVRDLVAPAPERNW
jgi:ABC-2 type transport system ATP-binding protein